jgi:glucose/arabinose dehydrogenase/mono/diheme cytochrome c family protein
MARFDYYLAVRSVASNPTVSGAFRLALVAIGCTLLSASVQNARVEQSPESAAAWAEWVEPDFPFFSSVVDARHAGPDFPVNNLTPRGLVLRLGSDYWAAFDVDLLRVAAIWRGKGVTPKALAPGSYQHPDRKTPGGQSPLPEPDGTVWLANGIYPGWQAGPSAAFEDPREPAPSVEEVGRGPLPEEIGRFRAIRQVEGGAVLEYTAAGTEISERMIAAEGSLGWTVMRQFRVGPSARELSLVLGLKSNGLTIGLTGLPAAALVAANAGPASPQAHSVWIVRVPPHAGALEFAASFSNGPSPTAVAPPARSDIPPTPRWPQEVTSRVTRSTAKAAYVVDDIALPLDNPWRRNLRLADIQFFRDGTAAAVTLDGDVWTIRGLHEASGIVHWRRFASGLHEPLTLAIRDEQVYVFDRNGIWRLRDTNGDGEADVHELFSNAFAQTADMREFPSTLRLAPGGEFVIAKGGQEAATLGKHNGSVLRISADGKRATVLGYGFRQPSIGVNVRTGLVLASDQQGNYVPSTPLHIVRDGQFYGFLSDKRPREVYPAPIADPLTWVPHEVNASALAPVWLFGARMGPLTDSLVYIGFNRPELFRVLLNDRTEKPQAAVVSVTRAFEFPTLNGSVNPADGQLYVAGFQIFGWGTTATRLAGLGRVRYTGAPSTIPRSVVPMDKGVLLRFDVTLDAATALDPDNYSLGSWSYKRTYAYGSPQFKADGTQGIDRLTASRVYLSKDRHAVFVAVPQMKPVMQMRAGWTLATADRTTFTDTASFTPYELPTFDPALEGFGNISVDLTPRSSAGRAAIAPSADEGRRLYQASGCAACHSTGATIVTMVGPTWKGLYGQSRTFANRAAPVIADDGYLRESILEPAAKIVAGYERGDVSMPSYAGVLTDTQIDALILYIKSLK